jgi:hypothetical protein
MKRPLGTPGSGQQLLVGSYEHDNEPSVSIKREEHLD